MPSTSKRKRIAAKRKASEVDVPDSSPSHSAAKKRRTNPSLPEPFRPDSAEVELTHNDEESDDTTSNAEMQELADAIIPHLAVCREPIAAVKDWSNNHIGRSFGTGVAAYAKVCGREWTYYVQQLHVNIGRPLDAPSRPSAGVGSDSSPKLALNESASIHIDLGPSKVISRLHAELFYNQDDNKWHVLVNGRNGMRVNDLALRRGERTQVNSGDILEIAGTQMMFVTASGRAVIHPIFIEKLRNEILDDPEPIVKENLPLSQPEILGQRNGQPLSRPQSATKARVRGQAVLAPAPPNPVRLTTPARSPRKPAPPGFGAQRSPALGRGIVMESSELIDYSLNVAKDLKPPLSYATMISQAILSTPEQHLSLKGIYEWISANFAYYRFLQANWQNSIRHNLSLNAAFKKLARGTNEPGKGSNWCINPEKREELLAAAQKQLNKLGARRSSAASSPAVKDHFVNHAPSSRQSIVLGRNSEVKVSPIDLTPPLASYPPTAQESYTPSRGPHIGSYENRQALPVLSENPSPLPHRFPSDRTVAATASSPTLTSGGWMHDNQPMMTPAPRPHNLNLPLPNTAKLPTSHMPDSSPAPFWKYQDQPLSTPAGGHVWPELSPLKAGGVGSSSPPLEAIHGNESPTGKRVMAVSRAERIIGVEDEDGGIDLARGFPNISTYHHHRSNAASSHVTS